MYFPKTLVFLFTLRDMFYVYADHNSGDRNNGRTKILGFFTSPELNRSIFKISYGEVFQNV